MDLAQHWCNGDAATFEVLFLRHKDFVLRTALYLVHNQSEAEDIVQTTFVRAYDYRARFSGDETGFKRWLYRIAVNLCMDSHRKRRKHLRLEELREKGFEPVAESSNVGPDPKDVVSHAMEGLDARLRSVVVLRYLHDMPYEEIASVLDIPLGTVKSRLHTAMIVMRKKLAEDGD